jgi:hypothetical protein
VRQIAMDGDCGLALRKTALRSLLFSLMDLLPEERPAFIVPLSAHTTNTRRLRSRH